MAIGPTAFLSTNINHRITSYDLLAERILFELGAPLINLEIACPALYDFIAQSIEFFTKYTGHTEEFLIFDSDLYVPGQGIRMDVLFSLTPELCSNYVSIPDLTGIKSFDYDMNTYRKVVDIVAFEEGTHTGINTLFTIEQSMAQQMHFAYGMGAKGFDIVTWHILKDWLEMREKVFALKKHIRFDPRTQIMRMFPEPRADEQFYGLVGCRVERPIRDLVKERWVKNYALALTKQAVAHTRGKFNGTSLFGGGTLNWMDLMNQGREDQKRLEEELKLGGEDTEPIGFFVG
jgi:hypothetical protein